MGMGRRHRWSGGSAGLVLLAAAACTRPAVFEGRPVDPTVGLEPPPPPTTPTDTGAPPLLPSPFTSWNDPVSSALRRGIPGARFEEGGITYLRQEDCAELLDEVGTCFGVHPASPYAQPWFPTPDQPEPPPIPKFQLSQDQALVFVGRTPPRCKYFGYNFYQYRSGADQRLTFGSIAPTLHLLDMRTADGPDAPFDSYAVAVFTANRRTASSLEVLLAPLLEEAGYSAELVNTVLLSYAENPDADRWRADPDYDPDEIFELEMGYGAAYDQYVIALRVAAPDDPTDPFMEPSTIPMAVFRVTLDDPPAYAPVDPWPHLPPEDWTGESQDELAASLDALVAAVEGLAPPGTTTDRVLQSNLPQRTGAECVNGIELCGANNDDARYLRSQRNLYWPDVDDPLSAVYVVGVNHSYHGRSGIGTPPPVLYNSLSLLNKTVIMGVLSVLDDELAGSVDHFFPGPIPGVDPAHRDSLYVHRFARDCGGEAHCSELGEDVLGVPPEMAFSFTERVYLNQTSLTAPHESSVLPPVAVAIGTDLRWDDEADGLVLNGALP